MPLQARCRHCQGTGALPAPLPGWSVRCPHCLKEPRARSMAIATRPRTHSPPPPAAVRAKGKTLLLYWPVLEAAAVGALLFVAGIVVLLACVSGRKGFAGKEMAIVQVPASPAQAVGKVESGTDSKAPGPDHGQSNQENVTKAPTEANALKSSGQPASPAPAAQRPAAAQAPGSAETLLGKPAQASLPALVEAKPTPIRLAEDNPVAETAVKEQAEPGAAAVRTKKNPERYGTGIEFMCSPTDAGKQARDEHKLLFVLHLSGNFEDSKFT